MKKFLFALLLLCPRAAGAEPFTETLSLDASRLTVLDLIGEVRVVGHDGPRFEVEISVQGEDAGREVVKIERTEGSDAEIRVAFPVKDESRFVYPRLGRGTTTTIALTGRREDRGSLLEEMLRYLGARKIRVSGNGQGLEVWADVTVKVPAGKRLQVDHGVGEIHATGVRAQVELKSRSGSVSAADVEGGLRVDTGSGAVEVERQRGDLRVDTGSGGITVSGCAGGLVSLDTGSGGVEVSEIECDELAIDTGSGGVAGTGLRAGEALVDTGSGPVRLAFERMGAGPFRFDTGSGSVDILLPEEISAELVADTGSGSIRVDVQDAKLVVKERNSIVMRVGAGEAQVTIDTGSGNISLKN